MAYVITIIFFLALIVLIAYSYPVRRIPFQQLYREVPDETRRSLRVFRKNHVLKHIEVDGTTWTYMAAGEDRATILFLHGMAGAYDIWWQVIEALRGRFKIVALTYPPVSNLEGLRRGIIAILEKEQVSTCHVIGSSLGGYVAQYLLSKNPEMINNAVFANTFPPNDLIARKTRNLGRILPFLPRWAVMLYLRQKARTSIYPASGNSEIVLAYMMEQSHGMMTKKQFIARYRCALDHFEPPVAQAAITPVLIIEADNDPLVEETLREMLKTTYPSARTKTLHDAGHFPYLNQPEEYVQILLEFFNDNASFHHENKKP
jgi:pimeloyl-ACP methyl ester carboxylesterase